MSKFVELTTQEQEQINGGVTGILESITDWLCRLLGLDDPDRVPIIH